MSISCSAYPGEQGRRMTACAILLSTAQVSITRLQTALTAELAASELRASEAAQKAAADSTQSAAARNRSGSATGGLSVTSKPSGGDKRGRVIVQPEFFNANDVVSALLTQVTGAAGCTPAPVFRAVYWQSMVSLR